MGNVGKVGDAVSTAHTDGVSCLVDRRKVRAKRTTEFNFNMNGRVVGGRTMDEVDGTSDNSRNSEAYSAHVLSSFFLRFGVKISVYKTENSVMYRGRCKITDYVLQFDRVLNDVQRLAVEVKRLSDFGGHVDVTDEYVFKLLDKANDGALESNKMVAGVDRWDTQILHVLTNLPDAVDVVYDWCRTVKDCGFSWVFVTVVLGNHQVVL